MRRISGAELLLNEKHPNIGNEIENVGGEEEWERAYVDNKWIECGEWIKRSTPQNILSRIGDLEKGGTTEINEA